MRQPQERKGQHHGASSDSPRGVIRRSTPAAVRATMILLIAATLTIGTLPVAQTSFASAPQTITFTDLTATNQPLNGAYPTGIINWGQNVWLLSGPWGGFTTNSVSFNGSAATSASFAFESSRRLVQLDAYNGSGTANAVSVTCSGQAAVQSNVPAYQVATISTGWTAPCSPVVVSSANGWNTNFTNLVIDDGIINAVQVASVAPNSATITWTTTTPTTSQVEFGATASYGQMSALDSTLVTNHSVSLSNLVSNTVYHFRVNSQTGSGVVSSSADLTFSTTSSACTAPITNPVACENSLQGNPSSEWSLADAGDPSIQGFATDISYNKGDTAAFKISTDAPAYTMTIYRLGSYKGLGARRIASVQPSARLPQRQPACLTDATTALVDCGNWAVSATWPIPSTAVSGIYFAKLTRSDTGGSSHVFFVVRDDSFASPILFQTSDTTWQAYNDYGGSNLYSSTTTTLPRAYKVSYNRPFRTATSKPESWVFNAEYPMVRWLEANAYNVSYATGTDSDRRGALLKNHKVFLSVGHDEYWSGAQRANVQAARDAGVSLAFLSGNEVFWKTRWESSIDPSLVPYRTLVSYKETHANAMIDPADPPTWTGTWRDPRFSPPADGGRPENGLTGTLFTVNGPEYEALTVPAEFAGLRFWRNTSVARLTAGQTATLSAGCNCILGYEWDEEPDNGARPTGLFRLSSTTATVQAHLQDYGSTYAPGPATHALTLYRASSGALVFGAGTVNWALGLDGSSSVVTSTPEPAMQQATVNLLADMGAQPATLQPGLIAATASTSTTAPTSTITSPAASATIPSGSAVTIVGTATATAGVVASVDVSVDNGATWHRATGRASWTYSWTPGNAGSTTLRSRAIDDSGNIETPSAGVTIIVQSRACPCSLWSTTAAPANPSGTDPSAVELGVKFTADVTGYITGVRFYKGTTNTGTHVGNLWSNTGTLLASATFTGETASGWQQVSFASPVAVTANTTYVASYHTNVGGYAEDVNTFAVALDNAPLHAPSSAAAGGNGVYAYGTGSAFPTNSYNASNYWVDVVFSTTAPSTPPRVVAQSPAPNATQASPATAVSATFNKSVTASTISFVLRNSANATVPAVLTYNSSSFVATLTPSSPLALATTYTATVSGATDTSGNVMTPVTWSFSVPACPCSLWSTTAAPANPSSTDPSAVELGVKFTADVTGYITGVRFYKGTTNTGTHVGNLWSNTGTLLASATFTGETASGWQQVSFASPVAVTANTTYVASYHTNVGGYADDVNTFSTTLNSGPLHAPSSASVGGNGVYLYGPNSGFPTNSYSASNYWVDVIFKSP